MQQAGHQQRLHDLRNATRQVQVDGQVLAGRLEVAQHRGFLAHALEVVNRPLDAGRMRNCQEVQHGIGRAPMTMITATAFSMDFRATRSRGLMSFLTALISTFADSRAEFICSSCGLAMVLE